MTETPDTGQIAGVDALDPAVAVPSLDDDALATFGERLRPSRRFYANPAGN